MQQRRSVNGRPSGIDGSDFSYRMVVDSRYTKVAKGKSRLSILILSQDVVQLLGALLLFYSYLMEEHIDQLAVLSTSIYFLSLLIGELVIRVIRYDSYFKPIISIGCRRFQWLVSKEI